MKKAKGVEFNTFSGKTRDEIAHYE